MMGDQSQISAFEYSTQIGSIQLLGHDNNPQLCYLIIPKAVICKEFVYFGHGRCLELSEEVRSMDMIDKISRGIDLLSGGKIGLLDDSDYYEVKNCAFSYICRKFPIRKKNCYTSYSKTKGISHQKFVLKSSPTFVATDSIDEYYSEDLLDRIPRMYTSLDLEDSPDLYDSDCSQCSSDLIQCQTQLLNSSVIGKYGQGFQRELDLHLENATTLLRNLNESLFKCNNDYFTLTRKFNTDLKERDRRFQDEIRSLQQSNSEYVSNLNAEKK